MLATYGGRIAERFPTSDGCVSVVYRLPDVFDGHSKLVTTDGFY